MSFAPVDFTLRAVVTRVAIAFVVCFLQAALASAQLTISEFRLRGPSGANDEFIEIYNATRRRSHRCVQLGHGLRRRGLRRGHPLLDPERHRHPEPRVTISASTRSPTRSPPTRPATGRPRPGTRPTRPTFPTTRASRSSTTTSAAQLHPRQPPRRRRLHLRGQHALQGRLRLPGADPVQHRLLLHAPAGWRLHRLGRRRELHHRVAHPDDAGPDHDAAAGHRQQRRRLHVRGHQRHQRRRRPAAGRARARRT